jgi:hypothetical protein
LSSFIVYHFFPHRSFDIFATAVAWTPASLSRRFFVLARAEGLKRIDCHTAVATQTQQAVKETAELENELWR